MTNNDETETHIRNPKSDKMVLKSTTTGQEVLESLGRFKDTAYNIISSKNQTKNWRKKQSWYSVGCNSNKCEKYQKEQFKQLTNLPSFKSTKEKFEKFTHNLIIVKKEHNKYDLSSEDFDGKLTNDEKILYINLKMLCEEGGNQDSRFKCVIDFISDQKKYLETFPNPNIFFVNILDGALCYREIIIMKKSKIFSNHDQIFIGDMFEFQKFINDESSENFIQHFIRSSQKITN